MQTVAEYDKRRHKAEIHQASLCSRFSPSEQALPSVPLFGRNCKANGQDANRWYVEFSFSSVSLHAVCILI